MGRGHEGSHRLDRCAGFERIVLQQQRFRSLGVECDRQPARQNEQFASFRQGNEVGTFRGDEMAVTHAGHMQRRIIYDGALAVGKDQRRDGIRVDHAERSTLNTESTAR